MEPKRGRFFRWIEASGLLMEARRVPLLLGVWLWLDEVSRTPGLWAALGSVLGLGAWYLTVHWLVVIRPVRAQGQDAA